MDMIATSVVGEADVVFIVADFEAGATSAEEFASQLGPVTFQMERMAAMAEAQGKTDLAALYRDIAAGLRNMIPALADSSDGMEKFNKAAGYADAAAGLFRKLGDAVGGDLGANITGIGNALSLAVDVAKDIATGNYFAAAIKVLSSLIDALAGFQKAKREALEKQKSFNEQFTLFRGDRRNQPITADLLDSSIVLLGLWSRLKTMPAFRRLPSLAFSDRAQGYVICLIFKLFEALALADSQEFAMNSVAERNPPWLGL